MGCHARRCIRSRVDDVKIDQFRPPPYHEWKGTGKSHLGTSLADESFHLRVGGQLWHVYGLPVGDIRPHKKRHPRFKALGDVDQVVGPNARERWSAIEDRHLASQALDWSNSAKVRPAAEVPEVELSRPVARHYRLPLRADKP